MIIRPGRYMTRDGREVYIAIRCKVNRYNAPNSYSWWVECGKSGWSVDEMGRHTKGGVTPHDIVSRVD